MGVPGELALGRGDPAPTPPVWKYWPSADKAYIKVELPYRTADGGFQFNGQLRNDSGMLLSTIRIELSLKNESGREIRKQTAPLSGVFPGEKVGLRVPPMLSGTATDV